MEITSFKISSNRSQLILNLSNAANATELFLWTNKTYKYQDKKLDFSQKLTETATQSITISLAELDLKYFDGVYFIEVHSATETCTALASDLTRYKEHVLDMILEDHACISCNKVENPTLINMHVLLNALEIAIENGFVQEILTLIKALDVYTTNECRSCGQYKNPVSHNYFTFNIVSG